MSLDLPHPSVTAAMFTNSLLVATLIATIIATIDDHPSLTSIFKEAWKLMRLALRKGRCRCLTLAYTRRLTVKQSSHIFKGGFVFRVLVFNVVGYKYMYLC